MLPNDPALQDIKQWTELRVKQTEPCPSGTVLHGNTTTKTDPATGVTIVIGPDGTPVGTLGPPPDNIVKDLNGNVIGRRDESGAVVAIAPHDDAPHGINPATGQPYLTPTPRVTPVANVENAMDRILAIIGAQVTDEGALKALRNLVKGMAEIGRAHV